MKRKQRGKMVNTHNAVSRENEEKVLNPWRDSGILGSLRTGDTTRRVLSKEAESQKLSKRRKRRMAAYLSSNTDAGQEPEGNKSIEHARNTPTAAVRSRAEGGKDDYEKGEGQLCTGMVRRQVAHS